MERRNTIGAVFGPKGSGKSRYLSDLVRKCPKIITLDLTGEARETYPDAIGPFFGVRELLDGFRHLAAEPGWHVIAALDESDVPELFGRLVPRYDGKTVGLARALGGVTLECGEVDVIAPSGATPREVLSAWRRGRHECLSLLVATQRPASCSRDVSAQADFVAAFNTSEPRDVAFIEDTMGRAAGELVRQLPPYHCAVYVRATRVISLLDPTRRVYKRVSLTGEVLAAS